MSVVYRKDPATGEYIAVPPPPLRRRRGLSLVVAVLGYLVVYADSPKPVPKQAPLQPVAARVGFDHKAVPHSLQGAMELYKTRGNKYIYGHNDCSTFLLDYLAGHGLRLAERQTTATLIEPNVAARMHLSPMDELELQKPISQSVVVMRYWGNHNTMVGHCAVRLFQNGAMYFVHNTESQGLVADTERDFYGRFDHRRIKDLHYYEFEPGF